MLIAQISDPHVRPEGELYQGVVPSNQMLANAIEHVNRLDPRPDLVLVTGDLVDEGSPAEYAAVLRLLSGLASPYYVIPGNHDNREEFRRAFHKHTYLPLQGPIHYCLDDHPVRIVALDTTVAGKHHGELDDAALTWLAKTLDQNPVKPTIIIMHHPPFACGIPYIDKYMCRAPERLGAVIERFANIERILCGHVHRPIQIRWAKTIVATCPSTTTQIALRLREDASPASYLEPPACLLHLYRPESGLITHLSPIGHFDGPFVFA